MFHGHIFIIKLPRSGGRAEMKFSGMNYYYEHPVCLKIHSATFNLLLIDLRIYNIVLIKQLCLCVFRCINKKDTCIGYISGHFEKINNALL